jgi:hypothetical protein
MQVIEHEQHGRNSRKAGKERRYRLEHPVALSGLQPFASDELGNTPPSSGDMR